MRLLFVLAATFSLAGCQQSTKPLVPESHNNNGTLVVLDLADSSALVKQAEANGIEFSQKDGVLTLSGSPVALQSLTIAESETPLVLNDEPMQLVAAEGEVVPDEGVFFLAKKEFGLPEFWETNPTFDGRGVIVGVIDDGVSPGLQGLSTTTTGARKYLNHTSNSSWLSFDLGEPTSDRSGYLGTVQREFTTARVFTVAESRHTGTGVGYDLNADRQFNDISGVVLDTATGTVVCVDGNVSASVDEGECFGLFPETGEFGYWDEARTLTIMASLDEGTLRLSAGEASGDTHGEGVASVLTGHGLGGRYDGVAPGAQMLDYDLSEVEANPEESVYTISTFLRSLAWLGNNGAEVVNISYSLAYFSASGQVNMQTALTRLTNQYNMVVSFSAGNNGPGLGSFSRGLTYPKNSLVAGAYVSKELDEYVHGVTGLPEEGRVISYSSRGPGPNGGVTPTVISPLASMAYRSPGQGFGAFSGTSSASPALAGLATVLISSVKQLELPVDAGTITHAIRQSAERLPGVPAIDQGAGLPNIDRALTIYKNLIAGNSFNYARIFMNGEGADGQPLEGVVIRTSELTANQTHVETYAWVSGMASSLVPADHAGEMLVPTNIMYGKDWVSGPALAPLSVGWSRVNIAVDLAAALADAGDYSDISTQIDLIDRESGRLLAQIPVTLIDDREIATTTVMETTLGAEEGQRRHFQLPAGSIGAIVNVKVLNGDASRFSANWYNNDGVIIGRLSAGETYMSLDRGGLYQIGLARRGGTVAPMDLRVSISPVMVKLETEYVSANQTQIRVRNNGSQLQGRLVYSAADPVATGMMTSVGGTPATKTFSGLAAGTYVAAIEPVITGDNFFTPASWTCFTSVERPEGTFHSMWGGNIEVQDVENQITVNCRPFEDITGTNINVTYSINIYPSEVRSTDEQLIQIPAGESVISVDIEALTNLGSTKNRLSLMPVFSNSSINLGTIEILP